MKKMAVIALSILVIVSHCIPSWADENSIDPLASPAGFMGIYWGQSFDSVTGLVLLPGWQEPFQKTGILAYFRPADELKFGDAELNAIHYLFTSSGFWLGEILASGEGNRSAILADLISRYGPPHEDTVENGQVTTYLWTSPELLGDIAIFGTYRHETEETMMQFAIRR